MYSLEMIKRHCLNKRVVISHDPEYEGYKGMVIECESFGIKIEISGKIHTFKYDCVEADRFPNDWEIHEFMKWWDYKKQVYKKEFKNEEPYNVRQVIFNHIKGMFTKRDLKKLENVFDRLGMDGASGEKTFMNVIEFIEIEGRNR